MLTVVVEWPVTRDRDVLRVVSSWVSCGMKLYFSPRLDALQRFVAHVLFYTNYVTYRKNERVCVPVPFLNFPNPWTEETRKSHYCSFFTKLEVTLSWKILHE